MMKLLWLGNIASIAAFVLFQAWWILIFTAFFTGCLLLKKGYADGYTLGYHRGYKEGIAKWFDIDRGCILTAEDCDKHKRNAETRAS